MDSLAFLLESCGYQTIGTYSGQEALQAVRQQWPDAAIIGTPPSSHVPLARKLLAAGVDVLVEKPVAASDERLQETVPVSR